MTETTAQATETTEAQPSSPTAQQKRGKAFKIFFFLLIICAIIYLIWRLASGGEVETDNAYVGADTAPITSMVNAQVAKVLVNDTQTVKKGDILVELDNRDAKIALEQAEAQFAKAQRQYRQTKANSSALDSQIYVSGDAVASARAQVAKAQADYQKAAEDLARRQQLVASGAVSKEELGTATAAVKTARAAVDVAQANLAQSQSSQKAARSNLAANNALIQGSSENDTPDALIAKANLEQAQLNYERTVIRAPIDGVVTQRNVQIGQFVSTGSVVMKIVPVNHMYVDANFKESQLKDVKVGQKAELTSDYYGKKVVYHGTVVGFSGGTGSAFALIPAQNATGNWIKVVQRLPVRIQLDPQELEKNPLRVGLSMIAKVDTSSQAKEK